MSKRYPVPNVTRYHDFKNYESETRDDVFSQATKFNSYKVSPVAATNGYGFGPFFRGSGSPSSVPEARDAAF